MNLELLDFISQIGIVIFGVLAIWLITSKEKRKRYWGSIFGLISQPFWFFTIIYNWQPGIIIVGIIYTVSWIKGIYNNR